MTVYNNAKVDDDSTYILTGLQFRDYCLRDVKYAERILDDLLNSHRTFPESFERHLITIRSYFSGEQTFEEFCREVRKFHNNTLCGLVWTNTSISYRCRTCAINPCMSLCSDCFHHGNHQEHDANMFRSQTGGICDCGDMTVMNIQGFCKHHGPNRIPNISTPVKLLRFVANAEQRTDLECCICRNDEKNNPLGLVVRLVDTGVVGVREMKQYFHNDLSLITNVSDQSQSDNLFTCCDFQSRLSGNQQASSNDISGKLRNKTCAEFYEEKIHSLLKIFSEKSVSKAMTISWRTGLLLSTCGHCIHLSCYRQYLQSRFNKSSCEIDPNIEFKCPMCRQMSNALIAIPSSVQSIESNGNLLESLTYLIERKTKPCVSSSTAEWTVNFIAKMYAMVNKNYRTIDHQDKELNDDILGLFLISILRFNLENDLLLRNTEHITLKSNHRKTCFRELFYICNLKYPYLSTDSSALLWYRLTGVVNEQSTRDPIRNINESMVPLLLCDPIALLLQILLSLPFGITKELYRVIVQILFNLTYMQSLFTIVMEMNENEREIWCNSPPPNQTNISHLITMAKYLHVLSLKLSQTNFHSNIKHTEIRSLESIHASTLERCEHFIEIISLIQHHLYQPIIWWNTGHVIQSDVLWRKLIKELQLYNSDEPYWFYNDSIELLLKWLDEILIIDARQWKLVLEILPSIPSFHIARFIELPRCYSDLFRICTQSYCSSCRKPINDPMICLICGVIYPQERSEWKCCNHQIEFLNEHLMKCSGGVNISININSTKTLIQRQRRYTYWSSVYLDEHGEEDLNLRRGRNLYLNETRLKLLSSTWISSNLDQLLPRWATDQLDLDI